MDFEFAVTLKPDIRSDSRSRLEAEGSATPIAGLTGNGRILQAPRWTEKARSGVGCKVKRLLSY